MRFRGNLVLVRQDETGKPVLDTEGRAEMKYRQDDPRSYRPSPGNLTAVDASETGASSLTDTTAPARKPKARSKPAAAPDGKLRPAGEIAIWTDGACTGNPGPMGIGMVVILPDRRIERGEFLGSGTNNIAELVAIERGLQLAAEANPRVSGDDADTAVRIYSDSGYSIGVLSMGWKAKANKDLIARIRRLLEDFPHVTFQKVAGHAGIADNERCDELAREAITTGGTVVGSA